MIKIIAAALISAQLFIPSAVSGEPKHLSELEERAIAEMICAECGDQPMICRLALAALVLNRVDSPLYPDDVLGVLLEAGAFPRYEATRREYSTDEIRDALRLVYAAEYGFDPAFGALCFSSSPDSEIIPTLCVDGWRFGNIR